uniref:ANK_REP_REGION domain-containing protein n=1 Tax=Rhabditophanes sp. KR3021 TaxID=114890 RepID=A0AC35THK3_9BILA
MDHHELINELNSIQNLEPRERIELARDRRLNQLNLNRRREESLGLPPPRNVRLRFCPEIALLESTGRGDVEEVERLLRVERADPNLHNEDGLTPLHQCAIDNNIEILRLLIQYGANVNAQDTESWTPLHAAACCEHEEIVKVLLANDANILAVNADGNMPYDICENDKTLDVIEGEMAARGITQDYVDQERNSAERQMLDDMKYLQKTNASLQERLEGNSTYLHIAAANGYYDVAAFLLRFGVSPLSRDDDWWMPVHAAACWNKPDLIELLCNYEADINAKTKNEETAFDLCEDQTTKALIEEIQQRELKKRRQAYGVRDSRRQSRRRKKYESPQILQNSDDNAFGVRTTIKRQSLRDKSGASIARLEAQKEHSDLKLIRTHSKDNVFENTTPLAQNAATGSKVRDGGDNKRLMPKGLSQKAKAHSPDEWLRQLDARSNQENEDENDRYREFDRNRVGNSTRKKKKETPPVNVYEMNGLKGNSKDDLLNRSNDRNKKTCCCVIS